MTVGVQVYAAARKRVTKIINTMHHSQRLRFPKASLVGAGGRL
jgi:hypothetical protein